jgi:hypothetical protein
MNKLRLKFTIENMEFDVSTIYCEEKQVSIVILHRFGSTKKIM